MDGIISHTRYSLRRTLLKKQSNWKNITLQNMASLIKYNLIPTETEEDIMAKRIYEFNRYLKSECKVNKEIYKLDERAINFLTEIDCLNLVQDEMIMSANSWDVIYQKWMDVFRKWIANNKQDIMNNLNDKVFAESDFIIETLFVPIIFSGTQAISFLSTVQTGNGVQTIGNYITVKTQVFHCFRKQVVHFCNFHNLITSFLYL